MNTKNEMRAYELLSRLVFYPWAGQNHDPRSGYTYCHYCSEQPMDRGGMVHAEDCPIQLAREFLRNTIDETAQNDSGDSENHEG